MRKFCIILIIFLLQSNVFASNDNNFDIITLQEENIVPVVVENAPKEKENPYTKEALKGIIQKEYDIKSTDGMFKNQLHSEFQRGIIKDIGLGAYFQGNLTENINQNSNFKYNMQLINVGLKGKFRSEKEGYNFLFDLTPQHNRSFMKQFVLDAYYESKRIPNHTIIFGTSRPTVGVEGGSSPYILPFINRSQTARNYGNIRKTGLRIKGNYKYVDYDIGGYSSDTWYSEFFPGVETDLWVNFKPLAKSGGKHGNLNIAGGLVAGDRNSTDFLVEAASIGYDYKNFWARAEYANADGSNGGSGLTNKKSTGYNLTLAYRFTKKLEGLIRFDDFDSNKKVSNNNTKEYTIGANYYILGQTMRLIFNYVFLQNDASKNSHRIIVGTQILL